MWFEGSPLDKEDIDDESIIWHEENRIIKPDFKTLDAGNFLEESKDDVDYIMDNTRFPYISIPEINVPHKDLFEEANHLLYTACFTAHRPCSSGWLSLSIHGLSSVHTNCAEDYNLPDDYENTHSDWTDIAKFCPKTVQWMQDEMLYKRFGRVRFMALLPDGWLGIHNDRPNPIGVGATNVALNNPDGCEFVFEGMGIVPFEAGSVMKLNTGYKHSVWNKSEEPRIHMIFDGDTSNEFKKQVNRGYAKMLSV